MEIKTTNIELNSNLALMPINVIETKQKISRKFYNFIKRTIDILAGIIGVIIMIPLTIAIYISHIITNDKRKLIFLSIQNRKRW